MIIYLHLLVPLFHTIRCAATEIPVSRNGEGEWLINATLLSPSHQINRTILGRLTLDSWHVVHDPIFSQNYSIQFLSGGDDSYTEPIVARTDFVYQQTTPRFGFGPSSRVLTRYQSVMFSQPYTLNSSVYLGSMSRENFSNFCIPESVATIQTGSLWRVILGTEPRDPVNEFPLHPMRIGGLPGNIIAEIPPSTLYILCSLLEFFGAEGASWDDSRTHFTNCPETIVYSLPNIRLNFGHTEIVLDPSDYLSFSYGGLVQTCQIRFYASSFGGQSNIPRFNPIMIPNIHVRVTNDDEIQLCDPVD